MDFQPTSEAVEAVEARFRKAAHDSTNWALHGAAPTPQNHLRPALLAAIAAFVEAEGLEIHRSGIGYMEPKQRLVGPWRKRDSS